MNAPDSKPTPERIIEALNAHQKTAVMKAAIELDVFTAIGEGHTTIPSIAARCKSSERGMRILCDLLVIQGFLAKGGANYALEPDAALFLDRRSPAYMASAAGFLTSPVMTQPFDALTSAVRNGTAAKPEGNMGPDDPTWVEFARSMAAMQIPLAHLIARIIGAEAGHPWKVLDVAAGHGQFGIVIGQKNPQAQIYALDWVPVLSMAQENANRAGIASRFHQLPGSAFDVDFGADYDLILLANFLQLLDKPTIRKFLPKVYAALKPGGRLVTVAFVPNEDRVSPAASASFALIALATTPGGDAYTFRENEEFFREAGFAKSELIELPAGRQNLIISTK